MVGRFCPCLQPCVANSYTGFRGKGPRAIPYEVSNSKGLHYGLLFRQIRCQVELFYGLASVFASFLATVPFPLSTPISHLNYVSANHIISHSHLIQFHPFTKSFLCAFLILFASFSNPRYRHGNNSSCLHSCNNHRCSREFRQKYPQENE